MGFKGLASKLIPRLFRSADQPQQQEALPVRPLGFLENPGMPLALPRARFAGLSSLVLAGALVGGCERDFQAPLDPDAGAPSINPSEEANIAQQGGFQLPRSEDEGLVWTDLQDFHGATSVVAQSYRVYRRVRGVSLEDNDFELNTLVVIAGVRAQELPADFRDGLDTIPDITDNPELSAYSFLPIEEVLDAQGINRERNTLVVRAFLVGLNGEMVPLGENSWDVDLPIYHDTGSFLVNVHAPELNDLQVTLRSLSVTVGASSHIAGVRREIHSYWNSDTEQTELRLVDDNQDGNPDLEKVYESKTFVFTPFMDYRYEVSGLKATDSCISDRGNLRLVGPAQGVFVRTSLDDRLSWDRPIQNSMEYALGSYADRLGFEGFFDGNHGDFAIVEIKPRPQNRNLGEPVGELSFWERNNWYRVTNGENEVPMVLTIGGELAEGNEVLGAQNYYPTFLLGCNDIMLRYSEAPFLAFWNVPEAGFEGSTYMRSNVFPSALGSLTSMIVGQFVPSLEYDFEEGGNLDLFLMRRDGDVFSVIADLVRLGFVGNFDLGRYEVENLGGSQYAETYPREIGFTWVPDGEGSHRIVTITETLFAGNFDLEVLSFSADLERPEAVLELEHGSPCSDRGNGLSVVGLPNGKAFLVCAPESLDGDFGTVFVSSSFVARGF